MNTDLLQEMEQAERFMPVQVVDHGWISVDALLQFQTRSSIQESTSEEMLNACSQVGYVGFDLLNISKLAFY
jgi:hypothetical protein